MKKNNMFKKCIFMTCTCIILMIVFSIIIKYDVEGEKKLPFSIGKILLVSTVDGDIIEDNENIWNIGVTQVNDIYMYINKNEEKENTTINSICLDNFIINKSPEKGNLKLLRPTGELSNLYSLSQQNYLKEGITYLGGKIDDMKSLEIGNNGGILGFRISITDLGSYISNENTEIIYDGRLLSNLGITEEQLKFEICFDITIETSDNIKYKGTTSLQMPVQGFIEKGYSNMEITDFSNIVFKRI